MPGIFVDMKSTRVFVSVLLIGVCVIGWMFFLDSLTAGGEAQAEYLEAAESYYEGKLYELAIEEYGSLFQCSVQIISNTSNAIFAVA